MKLHLRVIPIGRPANEGLEIIGSHMITPETETSSHYFYTSARNFDVDDADNLGVFRVVLVPRIVQRFACTLSGD